LIRGAWVLLGWLCLHASYMFVDGFKPPVLPADVAVVLGSKVQRDGSPSSGLQRRLERARDLYRKGAVKGIIVSGGRGSEGFEEADIMRDVLIGSGIPVDAIIVDRAGNNTRLTAIHAHQIMQSRGWRSAVAISQYYHVPRAKLALRQEGVAQVSGAAAEYRFAWTDPLSIVREFAGFYSYMLHRTSQASANSRAFNFTARKSSLPDPRVGKQST
jgi:vancomycin permeability regulator SanA